MENAIDRYLDTLLSFVPRDSGDGRGKADHATLIHVPGEGPERVYRISLDERSPTLTSARYRETVWEYIDSEDVERPRVDVLTAPVPMNHPVFEYFEMPFLKNCESRPDGCPGMDYFLLMWRVGTHSSTVECWDPLGREDYEWTSIVGAFQALSSQFEYEAMNLELASA